MEMTEIFWTFFITTTIAFLLALTRACYKSKCNQIDLCCIKITRNIDAEVQEDLELGNTDESKK